MYINHFSTYHTAGFRMNDNADNDTWSSETAVTDYWESQLYTCTACIDSVSIILWYNQIYNI